MEFVNDTDLTIIITGPKVAGIKVFIGSNRLNYIQKITVSASADSILPKISFYMPKFVFSPIEEQPKILNKDIIINIPNFLVRDGFSNANIYIGEKKISAVSELDFSADVQNEKHILTLSYPSEPIESIELAESIPWINVKRIV